MYNLFKSYLLSTGLLFFSIIGLAQKSTLTPLSIAQRILEKNAFQEMKTYTGGDYKGHPNGDDLKDGLKKSFFLLEQSDSSAVVSVELSDMNSGALDGYFHFKRDSVWRIIAFRALALTGMIEEFHRELLKLTPKQIDKIIAKPHTNKHDDRLFKSREDYSFQLHNAELVLSSDQKLIAYFIKHKIEFEDVKNRLIKQISLKEDGIESRVQPATVEGKLSRKLFMHAVSASGNGLIDFKIGGLVDNAVGYLFVTDKKYLPEMTPDEYIMLRQIGGGWYLYKTT